MPTASARSAACDAWLCRIARLGYAARGGVYLLVGGLAALAAFTGRGEAVGTRSALASLADNTFGFAVLVALCAGFFAYAAWRLVQAYYDVDDHGRGAKGVAVRLGLVVSAVAHVILGVWLFTLLAGRGSGEAEGEGSYRWTSWGLAQPGGRIVIALIGATIVGVGVAFAVKGWKSKFEKRLSFDYQRWPLAKGLCRAGLIARGFVFVVIGWFFIQAARDYAPGQTGGIAEVFQKVQAQPWGWLLLGVLALGLMAFGFYGVMQAIYRRIETPDEMAAAPG